MEDKTTLDWENRTIYDEMGNVICGPAYMAVDLNYKFTCNSCKKERNSAAAMHIRVDESDNEFKACAYEVCIQCLAKAFGLEIKEKEK